MRRFFFLLLWAYSNPPHRDVNDFGFAVVAFAYKYGPVANCEV